jgi:hypothetical protein
MTEDLVALRFEEPTLAEAGVTDATAAEFPAGVELLRFRWERSEVGTGEMVGFRSEWRVRQRLGGALQFAVGLAPEAVDVERFTEELREKGRFVQAFPLVRGFWRRTPSPDGTVYVQTGEVIVPTNCPAGKCHTLVGIGPLYSVENVGWTEVGGLDIEARPRPSNGP